MSTSKPPRKDKPPKKQKRKRETDSSRRPSNKATRSQRRRQKRFQRHEQKQRARNDASEARPSTTVPPKKPFLEWLSNCYRAIPALAVATLLQLKNKHYAMKQRQKERKQLRRAKRGASEKRVRKSKVKKTSKKTKAKVSKRRMTPKKKKSLANHVDKVVSRGSEFHVASSLTFPEILSPRRPLSNNFTIDHSINGKGWTLHTYPGTYHTQSYRHLYSGHDIPASPNTKHPGRSSNKTKKADQTKPKNFCSSKHAQKMQHKRDYAIFEGIHEIRHQELFRGCDLLPSHAEIIAHYGAAYGNFLFQETLKRKLVFAEVLSRLIEGETMYWDLLFIAGGTTGTEWRFWRAAREEYEGLVRGWEIERFGFFQQERIATGRKDSRWPGDR